MKFRLLLALFLGIAASSVHAQVSVDLMLDHNQFIPDESIPVKVRINNNSGGTLHFSGEGWLTYSVESSSGRFAIKRSDQPIGRDFDVRSGESAIVRGDLIPFFSIATPGRYAVNANVKIKEWDRDVSSEPVNFDIITGNRIWEQSFGLPQPPTNHFQPEVRKYIMTQATFTRRMQLYVRVTDGVESRTIHLLGLGPMISFSNPQMQLDAKSDLHLLFQGGAQVYIYCIINTDGLLVSRQTYYYDNTVPRMKVDSEGNISIIGGVRHNTDTDLPLNTHSFSTNVLHPPVP